MWKPTEFELKTSGAETVVRLADRLVATGLTAQPAATLRRLGIDQQYRLYKMFLELAQREGFVTVTEYVEFLEQPKPSLWRRIVDFLKG